jgi:lipid-binding SYLF domain-containing protein
MYRIALSVAAGVALLCTSAGVAVADETSRLAEAAGVIKEIRADIPQEYWDRAHCVAVIPNLKKGAFIFGGEYGKGAMSCRSGESWSAPVFMQIAKGSWGFQAGAEEVDLVLLVMNESGAQKMLKNKVNLGADASIAAGPLGRRSAVGTDAALTAEILSYSRSKGLFAGIDLSGGVLRPDEDANRTIYGRNATPQTILASRAVSAPPEAAAFLRALGNASAAESRGASSPSTSDRTARSSPPEPRANAQATADDNVRARLVDVQQTIDRLLADATPAPVGTTGGAGRDRETVTVDRAQLLQLRRQIEEALASLNRR